MADTCVFCQIIAGTIDKPDRYTDLGTFNVVAFEPLDPVTPGHMIVVPREHVADATDQPSITADVMFQAAQLAREHDAANIITSIGADATQTVFHLHIHVVPRRPGDGLTLPWTECLHCGASTD